jgi:non-heme chloroperoxidase
VRTERFETRDGLTLVADVIGDEAARPALFLHGGGQTRGSWKASLARVADTGRRALALDARGHGESGWSPAGDYSIDAFANDLADVITQIGRPPVLIGASLGGVTSLLLVGEALAPAQALILVDVAPRINRAGVARILKFMSAHPHGFGSLEEAADAVADYNPHRPRPASAAGLANSLRLRGGRYFWHWDPAFVTNRANDRAAIETRLDAAARRIGIPVLLVRAGRSDVVTAEEVRHMKELIPHSRLAEVPAVGHMIAGDDNSTFNAIILDFLADLDAVDP